MLFFKSLFYYCELLDNWPLEMTYNHFWVDLTWPQVLQPTSRAVTFVPAEFEATACPPLTCSVLQPLYHVIGCSLVFVLISYIRCAFKNAQKKRVCVSHMKVAAPIHHAVCQLVSLNWSWWPSHEKWCIWWPTMPQFTKHQESGLPAPDNMTFTSFEKNITIHKYIYLKYTRFSVKSILGSNSVQNTCILLSIYIHTTSLRFRRNLGAGS